MASCIPTVYYHRHWYRAIVPARYQFGPTTSAAIDRCPGQVSRSKLHHFGDLDFGVWTLSILSCPTDVNYWTFPGYEKRNVDPCDCRGNTCKLRISSHYENRTGMICVRCQCWSVFDMPNAFNLIVVQHENPLGLIPSYSSLHVKIWLSAVRAEFFSRGTGGGGSGICDLIDSTALRNQLANYIYTSWVKFTDP